jgi:hypothetical protein
MVKGNLEATEVSQMILPHGSNQFLLRTALGPGTNHNGCAVGIVGAEVNGLIAAQSLEAGEDVSLDVLHQMPEMDMPVGVRKG